MRPDGGGGTSPIIDMLNPLYDEICNLIAELAGNEAYFQCLEANFHDPIHSQPDNTRMWTDWFKVPGSYGFTVEHGFWIPLKDGVSTNPHIKEDIEQAATNSWHSAYDLYSAGNGNASILREWGRNVWEPDPSAMELSVLQLTGLMSWLQDQLAPGAGWVKPDDSAAPTWLANLKQYWPATSESSESFYDFWDDVNDKCALYVNAAERLAQTSAHTTATVNDFQANLLEVTQKTRDHARLALQQWQRWKAPSGVWPTGEWDEHETEKTILGGISYGTGVIALFPPAALVSGTISVVTGGLDYILPDKTQVMEATSAAKANALWIGYDDDVTSVCTHMKQALDVVHTRAPSAGKNPQDGPVGASQDQGFDAYVAMVKADRSDWTPPAVTI